MRKFACTFCALRAVVAYTCYMKHWLLLGALAVAPIASVQAQNTDTAGAPVLVTRDRIETDAAKILTAQFVRASAYIITGTLKTEEKEGQTLGTFAPAALTTLKGHGTIFHFSGTVLEDATQWKAGEDVLLFARFDGKQKRPVAIGKLPATPQNIARVRELVKQNPDVEIVFSTDKAEYALGEPVVARWAFRCLMNRAMRPAKSAARCLTTWFWCARRATFLLKSNRPAPSKTATSAPGCKARAGTNSLKPRKACSTPIPKTHDWTNSRRILTPNCA